MKKITEETCKAFIERRRKKTNNSEVTVLPSGNVYYTLFDNPIAVWQRDGKLILMDCGRQTQTTKERLNGILKEFCLGKIIQRHGTWYYSNGNKEERRIGGKTFTL